MEKLFDNFYNYKGFGPGINSVKAGKETCDYFKGRLPDQLIEYWQEYGFCGWAEGLFWTVNPLDYTDVLKTWLEGTPFEDKDEYYVITRTAFGKLKIWGRETGNSLMIAPQYGQIYPNETEAERLKKRGGDQSIRLFFSSQNKSHSDFTDESDKPLFDRAKGKLGTLTYDEMYAFVPALALGGRAELKNLQKVSIIEHLAFLADVGEKFIMQDVNKILGPVNLK